MPLPQLASVWLERLHGRKYLCLLLSLLALVIVRPLTTGYLAGMVVEVIGGLVGVTFLALTKQIRALVICALLILVALLLTSVLDATWQTAAPTQNLLLSSGSVMLTILFLCVFVWVILRDIFTDPARSWDNVNGALSVYLLTGYVFAHLYLVISIASPDAFEIKRSRIVPADPGALTNYVSDFIYYSFVTLSTLGYGDIAPVAPLARTLSWLEAVSGQLYLAVLVARLIAVQAPRHSTGS